MVSVNKSLCYGAGYCWSNCSSVFERDSADGKARVRAGQENSTASCISDSQANCCEGAIEAT